MSTEPFSTSRPIAARQHSLGISPGGVFVTTTRQLYLANDIRTSQTDDTHDLKFASDFSHIKEADGFNSLVIIPTLL